MRTLIEEAEESREFLIRINQIDVNTSRGGGFVISGQFVAAEATKISFAARQTDFDEKLYCRAVEYGIRFGIVQEIASRAMRLVLTGACFVLLSARSGWCEYNQIFANTSPGINQIGQGLESGLMTSLMPPKFNPKFPIKGSDLFYFLTLKTAGEAEWSVYDGSIWQRNNALGGSPVWETKAFEVPYLGVGTKITDVLLGNVTFLEGAENGSDNWLNYRYRPTANDPWQYGWVQMEFHEGHLIPDGHPARQSLSYVYSYGGYFSLGDALMMKDAGIQEYWMGSAENKDWDLATNWSPVPSFTRSVPTSTTNVLVADGRTANIGQGADTEVGSLYIGGLASGAGSVNVLFRDLKARNIYLGYVPLWAAAVDTRGQSGELNIDSGGKVDVSGNIMMTGVDDKLSVIGSNSQLSVENSIFMSGVGGSIHIAGGKLTVGDSIAIGGRGDGNTILVDRGGEFTMGGSLTLDGFSNAVTLAGGATASLKEIAIREGGYGQENKFKISGGASATANVIYVDNRNAFIVTEGGRLTVNNEIFLGGGYDVQNLIVSGTGSSLIQDPEADLFVGVQGHETGGDAMFNIAAVTDGGLLQTGDAYLGHVATVGGAVTVSGANSRWISKSIDIGGLGLGKVEVQDGGSLTISDTNQAAVLGSSINGKGLLSVKNSSFKGQLIIGDQGEGMAEFSGSTLAIEGFDRQVIIGNGEYSKGSLTLDDGSKAEARNFAIGVGGQGSLSVLGGSSVRATGTSVSSIIAQDLRSTGQVLVDGANSNLSFARELIVGDKGKGFINVQNQASLDVAGALVLGKQGTFLSQERLMAAHGELHIDSGGTVTVQGLLTLSYDIGATSSILADGGKLLANGGINIAEGFYMNTGEITLTNGSYLSAKGGDLIVGGAGAGKLSILSSSQVTVAEAGRNMLLGRDEYSSGELLLADAGSVFSTLGTITVGGAGAGKVTLQNGAVLNASEIILASSGKGSSTFDIGSSDRRSSGGTLNAAVRFSSNGNNSPTLNFNQTDNLIYAGVMSGKGVVNIRGSGNTIFTGGNQGFLGQTNVADGSTLFVDGRLGGSVRVGEDAVLGGSGFFNDVELVSPYSFLRPGNSSTGVGLMTIDGNLSIHGLAQVEFAIAGRAEGEYSQLYVNSWSSTEPGTSGIQVELKLADSYRARAGDTFHLLLGPISSPYPGVASYESDRPLPIGLFFNDINLESQGILSVEAYTAGTIIKNVVINGSEYSIFGSHLVEDLTFNTDSEIAQLLINGLVTVVSGDVMVDQGVATIAGGELAVLDDLNKIGNGTLNATGEVSILGDLNIKAGAYLVNGETTVVNTTYVNPGATLGGSGVLDSPNVIMAGTLSPGNSPGTLTINGNYTQTSSGTFVLEIASPTVFDQLIVNGTANLAGTLDVTGFRGSAFAYGQQFEFIQADEINGEFDTILMPISSSLRGRFLTDGSTGVLAIAPTSYTLVSQDQNQLNVAKALDAFIPATGNDQEVVSTALDLQSAGEYGYAFEQIAPGFYQSLTDMVIEQTNAQNQMLAQRLSGVRLGQRGFQVIGLDQAALTNDRDGKGVMDAKSGKDIITQGSSTDWSVFVMGNGIFSRVTSASQVPSYNFNSGGFTVGIDYTFGGEKTKADHGKVGGSTASSSTITLGLYTGYQGTYAKYSNGSGMSINSALFGGYASYGYGGFYSNLIVGGAYNGYSTSRSIDFSTIDRTARSKPNGGDFTTYLDAGYDLKAGDFTFGPILSGQYIYAGTAGFTESGADSLDLSVGQQNANSLKTNLGGRVAYTWQLNDSISLIPEGRMFWQHEYLNGPRNISASLDGGNGLTFGYTTTAPGRDSVFAGAGVTALFGDRWSSSFYYNADFGRQDYVSHMISATLGWKF